MIDKQVISHCQSRSTSTTCFFYTTHFISTCYGQF